MIKRIKSLISVKNLTASQFADILGVQRSNISHILSGRNKPSLDFILKILESFPNVSVEWLLNGNGEMFKGLEKPVINSQLEILTANEEENTEKDVLKEEVKATENDGDSGDFSDPKEPVTVETKAQAKTVQEIDSEPLDSKEIEQIMVFYKNGSFKAYRPQK